MNNNFVNFHILISHSPSCLNRDDMNMQKTAIFGGKRRVRISSQSLKRTMRKSPYYFENLGEPSIRSKQLTALKEEFVERLGDEFEESIIRETVDRFVKAKAQEDADDDNDDETGTADEKKSAVAPWIEEEIKEICRVVKDIRNMGLTAEERQKAQNKYGSQKVAKGKTKRSLEDFEEQIIAKKIEDKMADHSQALAKAVASALDVVMFGRMATSGLMTTIDGALSVAHSITTHTVDGDIDWFTAVDDLQELGSGHLDTQEFSSGVFYRYASLNLGQLQENLGGVSREKALEIAGHVLHMMSTLVPSAKQQSFAAHNLADLAFVSLSPMPVSLANAFEEPIRVASGGGFLKPSIAAFHDYWQRIHKGYGLAELCAQFVLGDVNSPDGVQTFGSLELLKKWLQKGGKE